MTSTQTLTGERADLIATLDAHRNFLLFTVRGLTDEQATSRPTASELTLAGIVKHVAHGEAHWADFAVRGTAAFDSWGAEAWTAPVDGDELPGDWFDPVDLPQAIDPIARQAVSDLVRGIYADAP